MGSAAPINCEWVEHFRLRPKYICSTTLTDFRSLDEPNFNVITAVSPKMKSRGMDFFAWDYNNAFPSMMKSIPGLVDVAEVDVYGGRTTSACFNQPGYRAHLVGKIACYLSQYGSEVQGVMWGCERMGPIDNMIGGRLGNYGHLLLLSVLYRESSGPRYRRSSG